MAEPASPAANNPYMETNEPPVPPAAGSAPPPTYAANPTGEPVPDPENLNFGRGSKTLTVERKASPPRERGDSALQDVVIGEETQQSANGGDDCEPSDKPMDTKLSSILLIIAVTLHTLCWFLLIGAGSTEYWIVSDGGVDFAIDGYTEHAKKGSVGLQYVCGDYDDNRRLCTSLKYWPKSDFFKCDPQDAGSSTRGLLAFGIFWVTIAWLASLALVMLHPSPLYSGACCSPLGGITPVKTYNPCKIHTLGAVAIAVACSTLFGEFWLVTAWGHYSDCFRPDKATWGDWKWGPGFNMTVFAWVILFFCVAIYILYAFMNKQIHREPDPEAPTEADIASPAVVPPEGTAKVVGHNAAYDPEEDPEIVRM